MSLTLIRGSAFTGGAESMAFHWPSWVAEITSLTLCYRDRGTEEIDVGKRWGRDIKSRAL
jgi:hypothetical protein